MPNPLVSVIIPAYNAAAFITETVGSVLAQTFEGFELIVINDGSPDTAELDEALAGFGDSVVYRKQPNAGPSSARNHGISVARGEWVAFLDSDDLWHPQFLAEQLRQLEQRSLDFVFCDAEIFGDSAQAGQTFMQTVPSWGDFNVEGLISLRINVITSCVVARRDLLVKAGMFDEALDRSEDFDLWVRCALEGARMGYQRQVLARHRKSAASLTGDGLSILQGAHKVFSKLLTSERIPAALQPVVAERVKGYESEIETVKARRHVQQGEFKAAEECFKRAWRADRRLKLAGAIICLKIFPKLLQNKMA
jgi:glycosyltransferase involved in cell wall biosynthesis